MKNLNFPTILFGLSIFLASRAIICQELSRAKEYFEKAVSFSESAAYDSSIIYFEKSRNIYSELEKWDKYVECNNQIGDNLQKNGNYEEALTILKKTLATGRDKLYQDHPQIAETNNLIGVNYIRKGNYDLAIQYLEKAISILPKSSTLNDSKLATYFSSFGTANYYKGNFDSALEYYAKALELRLKINDNENKKGLAISYNNVALIYDEKGYYDKALEYYKKAVAVFINVSGSNNQIAAALYNNIGTTYRAKGDFDNALQYYKKALSIRQQILDDKHPILAGSYNNIATIYEDKGDHNKSLEYYEKALSLSINALGETHPVIGTYYQNIANTFFNLGNYSQALDFIQKSISINQKVLEKNHPSIANNYITMGEILLSKDDFINSLEYLKKALIIRNEAYGAKHPEVVKIYLSMGKVFEKQEKYYEALAFYQKAIIAAIFNFNSTNIYDNPELQSLTYEKVLLNSLKSKADVFLKLYLTNSENIKELELSVSTYELISKLIDRMKGHYKVSGSKLFLAEKSSEIYRSAIKASLKLYEVTKNDDYKAHAFNFSEKNKARILFESLTDSHAKKFSGIPDSLLIKEKELRIELAFNETEASKELQKKNKQDSTKIRFLENKLFALSLDYQALQSNLEKNYPKYFRMKYKNDNLSVRDIQFRLDQNVVLLEYFISDTSIFIFTIDKNNYDVYSGSLPQNNTIKELNNSIYNLDTDRYLETCYLLYTKLVKPVESKIKDKRVLLIPEGILHYVPFDALLTKRVAKVDKMDYSTLPYLINSYTISYAYSATMAFYEILNSRNQISENKGFLGFAPVFNDTTIKIDLNKGELSLVDTFSQDIYEKFTRKMLTKEGNITPLPSSEEEIKSIYNMFLKKNKPALIFLNSDASEENIKSLETEKYKYIHIASHAFINERNSKLSGILLSSEYEEDGVLYMDEIYNLNLNADLAVLSACESGLGELVQGEGVIGLARGFIYSGAKNIIVSLWEVGDNSTSKLMQKLYEFILEGKPYSASLREAKLKIIEENKYSPPKYWAPFILVGN